MKCSPMRTSRKMLSVAANERRAFIAARIALRSTRSTQKSAYEMCVET